MEQPGPEPRPHEPEGADSPITPRRAERPPPPTDPSPPPAEPLPQPASTARAGAPRDPGHPVVIGYDGSPSSRNALAYAAGLARRLGQPLLVVYVLPFGVYCEPISGQVICATRDRRELDAWLVSELDQACDREGLDVSVVARRGNPAKELAAAADSSNADALVVGAPGHRLHHVAGSIPSWLARHARCPVIVVP